MSQLRLREGAVKPSVHTAADHNLVTAPAMVCAIPVHRQCAPEIGRGEQGDIILQPQLRECRIERGHTRINRCQARRQALRLAGMGVEPPNAHEENLARCPQVTPNSDRIGDRL